MIVINSYFFKFLGLLWIFFGLDFFLFHFDHGLGFGLFSADLLALLNDLVGLLGSLALGQSYRNSSESMICEMYQSHLPWCARQTATKAKRRNLMLELFFVLFCFPFLLPFGAGVHLQHCSQPFILAQRKTKHKAMGCK